MLADLLDLLLPSRCLGCRTAGPRLCPRCALSLDTPARAHVPTPPPPGLPPTAVVCDYDGPARALLLGFKERARLGAARPLGAALARAAARWQPGALVPVPSSAAAVRARGFDHALRLARVAGAALGVPVVPALQVVRRTADSAGLSATARAANLSGAFAVDPSVVPGLLGLRVVLVDDVVTTGASLAEAARALHCAGLQAAGCAAVAATVRRQRLHSHAEAG